MIGQRFALLEMKAMIAPLIHNFFLEPIDYLKDIQMKAGIVLRFSPIRIKFIPVGSVQIFEANTNSESVQD